MLRLLAGVLCEARIHYWVTVGETDGRTLRVPRSAIPRSGRVAVLGTQQGRTGINERDSTRVTRNELSRSTSSRILVRDWRI